MMIHCIQGVVRVQTSTMSKEPGGCDSGFAQEITESKILDEDNMSPNELKISLRGMIFEVDGSNFKRFPESRLAKLETENHRLSEQGIYFFDKNPELFHRILDLYSYGELHFPKYTCHDVCKRELAFWKLDPSCLASCCYETYMQAEELDMDIVKALHLLNPVTDRYLGKKADTPQQAFADRTTSLKDRIWLFLEDPSSSALARAWSIYLCVLLIGLLGSVGLSANHDFREGDSKSTIANDTRYEMLFLMNSRPAKYILCIETIGFITLSAELLSRFLLAKSKKDFFRNPANIFQCLVLVPIFISVLIDFILIPNLPRKESLLIMKGTCGSIQILLLVGILAKFYKPFRVLFMTMGASIKEIVLLGCMVNVGILAFAVMTFYVELERGTFPYISEAYWWALITMTTVGYGDYTPKTMLGRLVAGLCALCGLIIIALPVGVIGSNLVYNNKVSLRIERERKRNIMKNQKIENNKLS